MIPKAVLITGGRGFVGAQLCSTLAAHGWTVRNEPLRLTEDPDRWKVSLSSVFCVVHLAARVHRMGADREADDAYRRINVEGSRILAEQAANAGIGRFVFLSSIKVNGDGAERPYEASDVPDPSDSYGRSKWEAEKAVREVCERRGMECVIIRPPLIYGPGVKANFRKLLRLVELGMPLPLASIENRRSLIGLSNLIQFIETCMTHPRAAGQTWLIAEDESISTPELLRKLAQHMNRRSRLFRFPLGWLRRLGSFFRMSAQIDRLCNSLLVDATPARTLLGWRPAISLDEELARTVAAYRGGKAS